MTNPAKIWLIIPCAGVGSRVGASKPKQYLPLCDSSVLEQTLQCFLYRSDVTSIILAVAENDKWVQSLPLVKANADRLIFVTGGAERSDSVMSALNYLKANVAITPSDLVAIHDAARPCVSQADISAVFDAATRNNDGALLAVPSFNTLKQAKPQGGSANFVAEKTIDRGVIWQAYTPQVFRVDVLQTALAEAVKSNAAITDDASAVELLGRTPLLVEGSATNIKITQSEDLALAEFYINRAKSSKN
ncbi:MAG: 2-C-methyl-D-erythritol 4-phosphate cytidylyltransferase [Sinobacterium sp.]|nr:2-C-methyl-D-erythritol 4-phosphate cytidylyltransferase [Sinobacterium sp.]